MSNNKMNKEETSVLSQAFRNLTAVLNEVPHKIEMQIRVQGAETRGFFKGMTVTLVAIAGGLLFGFIILPAIFSHF